MGNPKGLKWSGEPGSPVTLKIEDIPDTGDPKFEVAKKVPHLKTPAVWFPHTILGISTSAILVDSTHGTFGPFAGQLFVGDQGQSKIMRVALEKVNGVYQGAVFPFREGFMSGVFRQVWGKDGSMYVGQTSRGWGATGRAQYGLQRLVWTGKVPFEPHHVSARPDGFEVYFTAPVDRASAENPASWAVNSFIYKYHHIYGSPTDQSGRSRRARRRRLEGWDERAHRRGFAAAGLHPRDPDGRREVGDRRIAAARLRLLHGEPDPRREGARGEAGSDREAERHAGDQRDVERG